MSNIEQISKEDFIESTSKYKDFYALKVVGEDGHGDGIVFVCKENNDYQKVYQAVKRFNKNTGRTLEVTKQKSKVLVQRVK